MDSNDFCDFSVTFACIWNFSSASHFPSGSPAFFARNSFLQTLSHFCISPTFFTLQKTSLQAAKFNLICSKLPSKTAPFPLVWLSSLFVLWDCAFAKSWHRLLRLQEIHGAPTVLQANYRFCGKQKKFLQGHEYPLFLLFSFPRLGVRKIKKLQTKVEILRGLNLASTVHPLLLWPCDHIVF